MMKTYLNLSNGLEFRDHYPTAAVVRIQSSLAESKAFWKMILDTDYGFLIDAATKGVLLVDGTSRQPGAQRGTRAQWQGVPWLKFAYAKVAGLPTDISVNSPFFHKYFDKSHKLRNDALKKLRYVAKMCRNKPLVILVQSFTSTMDGEYEELARRLTDAQ